MTINYTNIVTGLVCIINLHISTIGLINHLDPVHDWIRVINIIIMGVVIPLVVIEKGFKNNVIHRYLSFSFLVTALALNICWAYKII